MNLRKHIALAAGKTIFFATRRLKVGGGSAAPGLYALKIHPELIEDLAREIPNRIIITGTNGKTTTSRFLSHFAKFSNLKVINNKTGSNLDRGIASALIEHSSKLRNLDLSIWETDEAAFNSIAPKIGPTKVVFLNVFRDQLDRYGEVDTTIKKWLKTLEELPKNSEIFLNADDANLLTLTKTSEQKITFGLINNKISGEKNVAKQKNKKLDFCIQNIHPQGLTGITFDLIATGKTFKDIFLPIPGIYNLYNFLAAFSVGISLNLDAQRMIESLKTFSPAFGRVEEIPGLGFIFLIKNPVGATQVLKTLKDEIKPNDRILLALNDNLADGTDVSWIWDTDFEILRNLWSSEEGLNNLRSIIISGTRAYDLANRLKYAGIKVENIIIEPNLEQALEKAKENLKGKLFILPTYTALLELQKILTKQGIKKHYWREV